MIKEFFRHLFPIRVLKDNLKIGYTFCLGGLAFSVFMILIVTGFLLSFYYNPDVDKAYNSILFIEENVFLGKYLRSLHKISSHAFLVFIFLHTLRVVFTGVYRFRTYNWTIGMMLLLLSIANAYTGYLLPMDQLALWATQTGMELIKILPFGGVIRNLLVPDDIGGWLTLLRFYVIHILIAPLFLLLLTIVHFYKIRKEKGILPYL